MGPSQVRTKLALVAKRCRVAPDPLESGANRGPKGALLAASLLLGQQALFRFRPRWLLQDPE